MSDFTKAICEVMSDQTVTSSYPEGLSPAEILSEVWNMYPGEFQLCTVIDVCHERTAVYERLRG